MGIHALINSANPPTGGSDNALMRSAPHGATLLFAALLVISGADKIPDWLADTTPATPSTSGVVQRAPQPIADEDDIEEITDWDLFGTAQHSPVNRQASINAPQTRLQLTLRGVIAGEEAEGWAMITAGKGKEKRYRKGDSVTPGALLAEIHPDRVLLERNGQLETLKLIKKKAGVRLTAAAPAPLNKD
ncbi:MAG: type II secretion system protein N [Candidatus Sedimenticola sp. PURPLELP]